MVVHSSGLPPQLELGADTGGRAMIFQVLNMYGKFD
jgi:hypothetical protein